MSTRESEPFGARRVEVSTSREPVSYLVFSASLRDDSLNTRLANLAAVTIDANGGKVDVASMREFDAPSFDADLQRDDGFPPGARALHARLEVCDAFVIASPE